MIESLHRLVLLCIALVLAASLSMKSHDILESGGSVAFLPMGVAEKGKDTIRIRGNILNPGVYQIDCGSKEKSVTILTLIGAGKEIGEKSLAGLNWHSGDVLEINRKKGQYVDITVDTMSFEEMMILGIPLDPNRLSAHEWERLPGIGPVTAKKIIDDRQINGDFQSIDDLKRIDGIGNAKIANLKQYF